MVIDGRTLKNNAPFIVSGSHVSEMNSMISGTRPLYQRGFNVIKANLLPPEAIFKFLLDKDYSWSSSITLYSAFDGIIGLYLNFFEQSQEIHAKNLYKLEFMYRYLKSHASEILEYYNETLSKDLSFCLKIISKEKTISRSQPKSDVIKRLRDKYRIEDINAYLYQLET